MAWPVSRKAGDLGDVAGWRELRHGSGNLPPKVAGSIEVSVCSGVTRVVIPTASFHCRSFLFTLVNSEGVSPTKFDIVHSKYATLHHAK